MRESTVRGPAVDLSEFERRLRGPERKPAAAGSSDPLSELARLMQADESGAADPYGRILGDVRPPKAAAHAPELRGSYDSAPAIAPERRYEPAGYAEPSLNAPSYQDAPDDSYHGAEGSWNDDAQYLDYGQSDDYDDREPAWRRLLKPWHAVAAIALLAIVSIGWGFAHRGGGTKEIATIAASEEPVKIKPTGETDENAPDTGGAAVLDRKENEPVKQVVTNQEQAVEPTVTPKAVTLGNGPVAAPHEAAPSVPPAPAASPAPVMPPPKKVKTVTVRPDGSRVENPDALPPAVARATRPSAAEPPAQRTATPPAAPAKPTPKVVKPKPKPAPKVAAAPPPEEAAAAPAEPTDAGAPSDAAPAPISSGGYAVQFGAAKSEEEARELARAVSSRYGAALGGRNPNYRMAQVNGATVYRVRVGGFSKETASAICGRVKASGGNCFVAGN